jgi:hypothetical protein
MPTEWKGKKKENKRKKKKRVTLAPWTAFTPACRAASFT